MKYAIFCFSLCLSQLASAELPSVQDMDCTGNAVTFAAHAVGTEKNSISLSVNGTVWKMQSPFQGETILIKEAREGESVTIGELVWNKSKSDFFGAFAIFPDKAYAQKSSSVSAKLRLEKQDGSKPGYDMTCKITYR